MFRFVRDLTDVVSVLAYCPADKTYLLSRENSGEYWLPSNKLEKDSWRLTAQKTYNELFSAESQACVPLRVYKLWLPNHKQKCVFHVVYGVCVRTDVKRKTKADKSSRRLQWLTFVEMERQRAHNGLKSPELTVFAMLTAPDTAKDVQNWDMDMEMLVEVCEDNVLVTADVAAGAMSNANPNMQLLLAANYKKEDQLRLYVEFMLMVYPATYMSAAVFSQFMVDIGWQRTHCISLFRAADVNGRGGISYKELLTWNACLEPVTQHNGLPAEMRCKYIFRYFDSNRDMKLEYDEFKELVAAARAARQLPVDAINVAKDADQCLRQIGLQPNSQMSLAEFLRSVGELRFRGTSSLLRAPKSIAAYIIDLQERDKEANKQDSSASKASLPTVKSDKEQLQTSSSSKVATVSAKQQRPSIRPDYSIAVHTVKLKKVQPNEMIELKQFDENAVSSSTTRILSAGVMSLEVLGPASSPVEALAAVHYFAMACDKTTSRNTGVIKPAMGWLSTNEEASLGNLLLKLAEAVKPICAAEPRLVKMGSPVYIIGDLHGNLQALLAIEAALWSSGPALAPARLLFLGDFIDRGPHGAELMAYLLAAKLQRPSGVVLVRGNHETRDIQKMFTFYTECLGKYGETEGYKIWNAVNNVFDYLPLAAVVDDKVFCCHGGIPPPWVCPLITGIDKVPIPLPRPAEQSSIAWELLWNDPVKANRLTSTLALELQANEGFAANSKRGTGHVFDQNALDRFLMSNQLSHVVRAHELQQNGFMCQLKGRLITVFSSSRYCGGTNDSGVALLEDGKLRLMRIVDQ